MSDATIPTTARLTLWHKPDLRDELEHACARTLAPILARHGLVEPTPCPRPAAAGVLSFLYPVPSPRVARTTARALQRDPAWRAALAQLGPTFRNQARPPAPAASRQALRWAFSLYSAPAVPSRVVPVGAGKHGYGWHCYKARAGLASLAVFDLLQDAGGRMWLSHSVGVTCGDGGVFTHYNADSGLPHQHMGALAEDRQGRLWLAANGAYRFANCGICRYDGVCFEHFTIADGLPADAVRALLVTAAGQLWAFTQRGPAILGAGRFAPPAHAGGLVPWQVLSAREDDGGRVWMAGLKGVCAYADGCFEWYPFDPVPRLVWSVLADRDGQVWAGTPDGLYRRQPDGSFVPQALDVSLATRAVDPLVVDAQGDLWLAAYPDAVVRRSATGTIAYSIKTGLPGPWPQRGLLDRDRQVWASFDGAGVARHDGARITHHTEADGLLAASCRFVRQDGEGGLWVGTTRGTCRWRGGKWEAFDPAAEWSTALTELLVDEDGTLWGVEHHSRVRRWRDGAWEQVLGPAPDSAHNGVLVRAWDGALWCANGGEAEVHRLADGVWTTFAAADGVPAGLVRALAVDRSRQRVWLGTTTGELGFWQAGRFAAFDNGDRWGSLAVLDLHVDRQGRLWVGTEGSGAACWDGDAWTAWTMDASMGCRLPNDVVLRIGEDRRGRLVFCTQGGGVILHDGQVTQTLDEDDGLASSSVRDFLHDATGAYWFATDCGLTCYRPAVGPPRLRLTRASAGTGYFAPANPGPGADQVLLGPDGTPLPAPLRVPIVPGDLDFAFHAGSLTARPEAMLYRHRLRGHEQDWQMARTGVARYERLPLGEYTFEVQAVDPDLNYSEVITVPVEVVPVLHAAASAEKPDEIPPTQLWIGGSAAAKRVYEQLCRAAPANSTVLLTGATGTGKTLAAECLHKLSGRTGPLQKVSCGALPSSLIESALFGHERGAFTGAIAAQVGKVEAAAGGTLFLDEMGDISTDMQVRLLRLLEERVYERLGSNTPRRCRARIVAATNRDLAEMVRQGTFREDLFHRLNAVPISLPLLRERREDIVPLALQFVAGFAHETGAGVQGLTRAAAEALLAYEWPGNIRELRNVMEHAVQGCRGALIDVEDLRLVSVFAAAPTAPAGAAPARGGSAAAASAGAAAAVGTSGVGTAGAGPAAPAPVASGGAAAARVSSCLRPLDEQVREILLTVLEAKGWMIEGPNGAAAVLKVVPSTLRSLMRRLGICRPREAGGRRKPAGSASSAGAPPEPDPPPGGAAS